MRVTFYWTYFIYVAFDEENLLERLQKIETLKRKIVKARQELQAETSKLDKEVGLLQLRREEDYKIVLYNDTSMSL